MDNSGIISLPQGGGAIQGIGETFSPDLFTGTGNFTVPIALPPGRNGFQPQLNLQYSTGNGNDVFGLGWLLSVPSITRKTSSGIPRYQDTSDVFVLSGAEDLVPVSGDFPGIVRYRPRTEGLFARIEFHRDAQNNFWVVRTKDGLVHTYGNPAALGNDPAVVCDPNELEHVFAWRLTETRDPFGNRIRYQYESDGAAGQIYLSRIEYIDVPGPDPNRFLVSVDFSYENRPDPFSTHRSGFPIRTTRRCSHIEVRTEAELSQRVRTYQFVYESELPLNGVSQLSRIHVIGHNDAAPEVADRTQQLPPLEFSYSRFRPDRGDLIPLSGRDLPAQALSASSLELVDLFGTGLPDLIEMNGTVRYWRNLGGGRFDLPRMMSEAPAGVSLADPGVQLIDADGDGRTDLLVTTPDIAGYYPLRFGGFWDQRSFQRYNVAPGFSLKDADVRLVDLNGDGVTDAIRADNRLELYFNDPHEGWGETRRVERRPLAEFPDVNFTDPRVHWADMCGDGLSDVVMVHDGNIEYWPNLGHGNWGARVHMQNSPRLPFGYSPRQVLIGDVDGDGVADLIFVDRDRIFLWINQSGNGWSDPIEIDGTPAFTNEDDVRLVDLLGTGVAGVLWSTSPLGNRRERGFFLDLTGGMKPYLLNRTDNHRGAITEVTYRSSTEEYLRDQAHRGTRWKTTLPFPVQVVSKVVSIDEFSRGRMTTEYRYHHGYWDGAEREYRGFGCVESLNSETFENYYDPNTTSDAFDLVEATHFSPPTLSRSWFHLGPVGDEFGDWQAVDFDDEYWSEDAPFFNQEHNALLEFLAGLERRNRRDALRTLRGTTIRTELYAIDDTPSANRPYTVKESVYGLREIETRIFFPHQLAERTTQWERGDDPLTQIAFKDDYDEYGQPRQSLNIACPRGWKHTANESRPGTEYLTIFAESRFSQRDDDVYLVNRQASSTSFQIYPPQDESALFVTVRELREQALNESAPRQLTSQAFNYFDGEAFTGLPLGQPGQFGALVRTETLITTEEILAAAYQSDDEEQPSIPPYLDPNGEVNWPDEYPERFRAEIPLLAGYRFNPGDADHARGYFIDSAANRYDFQIPGSVDTRGMLTAKRDALEHETTIEHDEFAVLPIRATNPTGLVTTAQRDYRVLQPNLVIEPNGNRTAISFTALGLPQAIAIMGKEDEPAVGDTPEAPGTRFEYELLAYDNSPQDNRQPLHVRTIRRVHHVNDAAVDLDERDNTIETVEYSDGFGRLLQTRAQAEDVLFGDETLGNDVLPADQSDATATAALIQGRRQTEPDRPHVVVSGWQTYDNKGNVVEKYESFFDAGWDYLSRTEAEALREEGVRNLFGQRLQQFYDPRGQLIRTLNSDGSERRIIYGVPADLSEPDNFNPTPWEVYTYDANDLAPVSHTIDATPLTDRAPVSHHFTPSSTELDALGRTIRSIERNGAGPENQIETVSTYDIRGNLLTVDDPLGRTAFSHVYDLANNPVRVVSIDAGIKRNVHNALGLVVEQRDSKGAAVFTTYDALKRIVNIWSRDSITQSVTRRQHLVYGDNASEIGIDRDTARERNALEKLVVQYDTAGRQQIISYDFKGNLLEKTRQVISDEEILFVFAGAAANDWEIAAYQVDWDGEETIEERAAAILDSTVYTTSFAYDGLNRVTEVTLPQDVESDRKLLQQTYNRAGNLERITLDGDTYVERTAYNAKGQRNLIAFGNGTMMRYAYDPHTFRLARLRGERYTQPADFSYQPTGPTLQDIGYDYDLSGNLVTLRDRTPECGIPNTVQGTDALDRRFTYDAIYRLLSATGRECNVLNQFPWSDAPRCTDLTNTRAYTEQYQYDANGNMLVLQHQNELGGFTRQLSVSTENNRLEALTIGQTGIAYSYDASGNMVQETSSRHFEWDFVNRLKVFRIQTEGAEPSVFAHYLYDASGTRVKKIVRRQGGQFIVTNYIDGIFEHHRSVNVAIEENNSIHVMDGTRRIAQRRVGQAFVGDQSPAIQFQITDHLGSASVIVDHVGALINREEFTPYGETSFGSFARKRYRFTGKERDEESGLNYHGARYYAPWLARWTATDPIGMQDGLNVYAYCQNSPCGLVDHAGLAAAPPPTDEQPQTEETTESDEAADRAVIEQTEGPRFELEDHTVNDTGWVKLPKGPGLSPRKNKQQFGLTDTIDALKVIAAEWERRHPGRVIWIGDISKKGGGPLGKHKSHQRGIDVDVAVVLHDPKKRGKFSFTNPAYSRELTQELITLFHTHSTLPVEIIFYGDPQVEVRGPDEPPRTVLSDDDNNHRSHFHVRFEHPTEGRKSRKRKRKETAEPSASPAASRSFTGITGVDWVWPNAQPLGLDLIPHLRF